MYIVRFPVKEYEKKENDNINKKPKKLEDSKKGLCNAEESISHPCIRSRMNEQYKPAPFRMSIY